ncbi:MAG TPA: hypothetical protein VGH90_05735 [Chthoniobacteraceae bacterium]|jgi:hypothetical protein
MKTQTVKTFAALLGVAVALNLSALAGPGPQSQPKFRTQKGSDGKNVVAGLQIEKAPAAKTSVKNSTPHLIYISAPHGVNFEYAQ